MSTVTLDGYQVVAKTSLAVGLLKAKDAMSGKTPQWVPRSVCESGESLDIGDTDICVKEWFAEKEDLNY